MIIQQISIISTSTRKRVINSNTRNKLYCSIMTRKASINKLCKLFLMLTIRGIWLDKAVMRSGCVRGFRRHIDLNAFLQSTHNS